MKTVEIAVAIFLMLLWYAVITIPCTVLIVLPLLATRRMRAGLLKHFIQSALIAVAYAPVLYGHAGPIPAIVALMFNDPMFRMQAIVSLVFIFVISFAVLTTLALRKNQRTPDQIPSS